MVKINFVTTRRKKRKKVLKLAKGYFGSKSTLYKTANEQVMRSLQYAYRDRRQKKRNFRKLWITRINAGCVNNNMRYSRFIHGLTLAKIEINRKLLADVSYNNPDIFLNYIKLSKEALEKNKKIKEFQTNKELAQKNIETKIKYDEENNKKNIDISEVNTHIETKVLIPTTSQIKTENKKIKEFQTNKEFTQKNIEAKIKHDEENNKKNIDTSEVKKLEDIEKKLNSSLLSELRILAKKYKIKNISKFKKAELIDHLKEKMISEN